jgi:hypothetical protein
MITIYEPTRINLEPTNVNWRGPVAPAFRTKKAVLDAMGTVANPDRADIFKAVKKGSRWFLIVGQMKT